MERTIVNFTVGVQLSPSGQPSFLCFSSPSFSSPSFSGCVYFFILESSNYPPTRALLRSQIRQLFMTLYMAAAAVKLSHEALKSAAIEGTGGNTWGNSMLLASLLQIAREKKRSSFLWKLTTELFLFLLFMDHEPSKCSTCVMNILFRNLSIRLFRWTAEMDRVA